MDKWDRITNFCCNTCMFYVPKNKTNFGRCRKNAPTLCGYPIVYLDDWCGQHKLGSNPVRDNK